MLSRSKSPSCEEGSGSEKASRRRVNLACNFCRSRKIRCGGGNPCANCVAGNWSCSYQKVTIEQNRLSRERKAASKAAKVAKEQGHSADPFTAKFVALSQKLKLSRPPNVRRATANDMPIKGRTIHDKPGSLLRRTSFPSLKRKSSASSISSSSVGQYYAYEHESGFQSPPYDGSQPSSPDPNYPVHMLPLHHASTSSFYIYDPSVAPMDARYALGLDAYPSPAYNSFGGDVVMEVETPYAHYPHPAYAHLPPTPAAYYAPGTVEMDYFPTYPALPVTPLHSHAHQESMSSFFSSSSAAPSLDSFIDEGLYNQYVTSPTPSLVGDDSSYHNTPELPYTETFASTVSLADVAPIVSLKASTAIHIL